MKLNAKYVLPSVVVKIEIRRLTNLWDRKKSLSQHVTLLHVPQYALLVGR